MSGKDIERRPMFEWDIQDRHFCIRDVESEPELHSVEEIQKQAWGFSDLDIVPAATLIATQHAGGIVLGAFEGDQMIGFAYAFPAFEDGQTSMHSHMLAVLGEYRNFQAGFYLKVVQRERVLAKGLDEVSWTFDPLQTLNAHLNFSKLGVVSRRYLVNFYGEATSSPLHTGFGTDRLWVSWLLKSERVERCIARGPSHRAIRMAEASKDSAAILESALIYSEGGRPVLGGFKIALSGGRCTIEIPRDITAIKHREPALGIEWRQATRAAFLAAIDSGFLVEDFVRIEGFHGPRWFYTLTRQYQH
jgi:predicted GNAT superfamily acetyltransferase